LPGRGRRVFAGKIAMARRKTPPRRYRYPLKGEAKKTQQLIPKKKTTARRSSTKKEVSKRKLKNAKGGMELGASYWRLRGSNKQTGEKRGPLFGRMKRVAATQAAGRRGAYQPERCNPSPRSQRKGKSRPGLVGSGEAARRRKEVTVTRWSRA